MTLKTIVKRFTPEIFLSQIRKARDKSRLTQYKGLTVEVLFSNIYENNIWGAPNDSAKPFFSGQGSHDNLIVLPYVQAVREFLKSLEDLPNVVDLGCGDFNIGAQIRESCNEYIACDVVPKLIEFNRDQFKNLRVDFRLLDLARDELPPGDVVFIRQVLQHLSNHQIGNLVEKISSKYKYLVLTEELPCIDKFKHNIDKAAGPDTRMRMGSGVVLTSAPFNLAVESEQTLCKISNGTSEISTIIYRLC